MMEAAPDLPGLLNDGEDDLFLNINVDSEPMASTSSTSPVFVPTPILVSSDDEDDEVIFVSYCPPSKSFTSSARAATQPLKRRKTGTAAAEVEADKVDDVSKMSGWNGLPDLVLLRVLHFMPNLDVVSAGQTCRHWRAIAKQPCVWRRRTLSYDPEPEVSQRRSSPSLKPRRFRRWHAFARQFTRVILFAPVLAVVRCGRSMKDCAREAVKDTSECKVRGAELNGQLVWTRDYMMKQRETLEAVILLNPKRAALNAALKLPRLASLEVAYEQDVFREQQEFVPYRVPTLPAGIKGCATLVKLTCRNEVDQSAVESLVRAHAASLQEVSVSCLPRGALSACAKLRHLAVRLSPGNAEQEATLRRELRGKKLESLVLHDMSEHGAAACATLRHSLQAQVRQPVACEWCSAAPDQRRAPERRVVRRAGLGADLTADFISFFGAAVSSFGGFGGCACNACCAGDDYDDY